MRDRNVQRPVYLLNLAKGENRVADLEAYHRATALLRSEGVPFKVLATKGVSPADPDVLLIPEEFKETVFALASGNGLTSVIYLAFDRVAYKQTDSNAVLQGEVIGQLGPVDPGYQGAHYLDLCHNTQFAIN